MVVVDVQMNLLLIDGGVNKIIINILNIKI